MTSVRKSAITVATTAMISTAAGAIFVGLPASAAPRTGHGGGQKQTQGVATVAGAGGAGGYSMTDLCTQSEVFSPPCYVPYKVNTTTLTGVLGITFSPWTPIAAQTLTFVLDDAAGQPVRPLCTAQTDANGFAHCADELSVGTVESPYFHVEYAGVPGVYLPSRSGEVLVFSPYDQCTGGVAPALTAC